MTITIRELRPEDISEVAAAFAKLGWDKPASQYEGYLAEQEAGTRTLFFAFDSDNPHQFIGYITIIWEAHYPPDFRARNIPEIADFNVLPDFRRRGIGTQLMDAAESCVAERADIVGIGVGMTPDYGAAQRLYVKRGYIPDGTGLHSPTGQVQHGESVVVDDGLILYFTKHLKTTIKRPACLHAGRLWK
jgi:GNAT superfamily N-acetyltransferase